MPTNIVLGTPSHPLNTLNLSGADEAFGLAAVLVFSFTGLGLELLALLGSNGGACTAFLSFCLIVCSPALAAIFALGIARTRPTCCPEYRRHSLER